MRYSAGCAATTLRNPITMTARTSRIILNKPNFLPSAGGCFWGSFVASLVAPVVDLSVDMSGLLWWIGVVAFAERKPTINAKIEVCQRISPAAVPAAPAAAGLQ